MFGFRTLIQRAARPALAAATPRMAPVAISTRFLSFSAIRLQEPSYPPVNVEAAEALLNETQPTFPEEGEFPRTGGDFASRDPTNLFVSKSATSIEAARNEERVVTVNNLPYEARWEDVFRVFGYYGEIERIKFLKPGVCFVHFVAQASADKAITALNETYFHRRRIWVQKPTGPFVPRDNSTRTRDARHSEPTSTVYLGNMPYEITESEILDMVKAHGEPRELRFPKDPVSGLPKGFAHAEFETVDEAVKVVEGLQGITLKERNLIVNYATARIPRNDRSDRPRRDYGNNNSYGSRNSRY